MDFYQNKVNKNPYNTSGTESIGLDLREELRKILHDDNEGSFFVYRRVRRDAQGYPLLADSTKTNRSGEATYGTNKGMKYLFDDHMVIGYLSSGTTFHDTGAVKPYGDARADKNTLFLEYNVLYKITNNIKDMPNTFDKIFVPELDINGNLSSPLKSFMKYDIGSPEPYRLDGHGRVEFFRINLVSNMDDSIQL